jgi:hypothetical protein
MNSRAAYRETVWETAFIEGNGHVYCIHPKCRGEIFPGDDWDVSHHPIPKCLGGKVVGPGHRRCNIKDNVEYVTPTAARVRRKHRWHVGITGPGLSANALPGGRRDNISKKLTGEVVPRISGKGAKHRQTMAQFPNRRPT